MSGGHKATQELSDHLSPGNTNYYQKVFIDLLNKTEAVVSIERLDSSTLTNLSINEAVEDDRSVASLPDLTMVDNRGLGQTRFQN